MINQDLRRKPVIIIFVPHIIQWLVHLWPEIVLRIHKVETTLLNEVNTTVIRRYSEWTYQKCKTCCHIDGQLDLRRNPQLLSYDSVTKGVEVLWAFSTFWLRELVNLRKLLIRGLNHTRKLEVLTVDLNSFRTTVSWSDINFLTTACLTSSLETSVEYPPWGYFTSRLY